MTYLELEFPGDADDARVRSGRNISELERWLSLAAGTGLALYGLSRRKPADWVLAAFGGMLIQRGATGHCFTYEAFGINTAGTGDDTRRALGGSDRQVGRCSQRRHCQEERGGEQEVS